MNNSLPDDPRLHTLLREARPAPDLPPGFQKSVWRRIEQAGARPAGVFDRLDELVAWLLRPRLALAGATALVLLGITIGVVQGGSQAHNLARDRYLAAVNPLTSH